MNTLDSINNFKKQLYISFGPSCLSAEILKACNLRVCTFGFDWFRSGSYHHSLFFKLKLEDFLRYHVYKVSAPLRQKKDPNATIHKTSELEPIKQLYGYNILYNPHRNYNHGSFQYFERAFQRLNARLDSKDKDFTYPTLLMTDYINKEHYSYFSNTKKAAKYLRYNFLLKYNYMPSIKIIRFLLTCEKDFQMKTISQKESDHHIEYIVPISHEIDADTSIRRVFYKSLDNILR